MQPFWSYSAQLVGPGYRFRTFRLSRLGGNVALPRIELWNVAKGWGRHPSRGAAGVAGGGDLTRQDGRGPIYLG